jgi:glycosyltransferase involved in cell wall biosynthesis
MKVGLIGPIHPFRSGEAQSNTMLLENLSERNDVIAFSFKRLYPKRLFPGKAQTYESQKELSFETRFILDSLDPVSWARTAAEIRKAKLDVVLVTWWTIFLAPCYVFLLNAIKRTTNTRICIFPHNVYPHDDSVLNKVLARAVLPLADYYVCISSKCMNDLKQLYPDAKVKLLLEPTYDHHFNQQRTSREQAREKLGIKEANVALFFGLVRPYKGLDHLINAMPEALAKADIRFLVVGEFWEDPKRTEELAERLGVREKLTIVNRFVSDEEAVVYFDASDVFVLPYVSATSTAVIPLAYGYERPVIVTNIPGLTDIVDDGRTGYVVPPQNPSALADALVKFFTSTDRAAFTENVMKKRQELQWSPEKDAIVFHGMS